MHYDLLIAGMIRESHGAFWNLVAERFENEGLKVAFMPAMDEAALPLAHRGDAVFCVPGEIRKRKLPPPQPGEIERLESDYGLTSLRKTYIHEMYSTERYNERRLRQKAVNWFRVVREWFENNTVDCVIEETGGWIECQTVFRVARNLGLPHIFIEPGPLKKTTVFALNSWTVDFGEILQGARLTEEQRRKVDEYIDRTTADPKLLVPHKDRSYYRDATLFNVINPGMVSKFFRILHRKVFVNRFDETFSTRVLATRYLKSVARRYLMAPYYTKLPDDPGPFVYFPLHMPFDMQILVRAPQAFRQEYVIEQLSRALPQGVKLLVKEHPVSIGWMTLPVMRMIAGLPNVKLLHPGVSSHEVIKKARAVVTINSKVGFEALAYYKPVVTLGASFYRGHGATIDVVDPAGLAEVIRDALQATPDRDAIHGLFATILERSPVGDLYENSPENLDRFVSALQDEIRRVKNMDR